MDIASLKDNAETALANFLEYLVLSKLPADEGQRQLGFLHCLTNFGSGQGWNPVLYVFTVSRNRFRSKAAVLPYPLDNIAERILLAIVRALLVGRFTWNAQSVMTERTGDLRPGQLVSPSYLFAASRTLEFEVHLFSTGPAPGQSAVGLHSLHTQQRGDSALPNDYFHRARKCFRSRSSFAASSSLAA